MREHLDRSRSRLLDQVRSLTMHDDRVIALVAYGSDALGRADAWSDLDLVVFVRDDSLAELRAGWRKWLGAIDGMLLMYEAGGSPRAIFTGQPTAIRVDLTFIAAGLAASTLRQWSHLRQMDPDRFVLLDKSPSRSIAAAAKLSSEQAAEAIDLSALFAQSAGDIWYYLLRIHAYLQRGEEMIARTEYQWLVINSLATLMRIEAGSLSHWGTGQPANRLNGQVAVQRLAQLTDCTPDATLSSLRQKCLVASRLGAELCQALADRHAWAWPSELCGVVDRSFQDRV